MHNEVVLDPATYTVTRTSLQKVNLRSFSQVYRDYSYPFTLRANPLEVESVLRDHIQVQEEK